MIRSRYTAAADEVSRTRADARIAWLRTYAARRINSRLIDERRCIPPYVALDFGNQGLMGMQVEERYGGLALRNRDIARVLEQAAAIDLGLGGWLTTCIFPGIRPIATFATDAVKSELLPLLARGRMIGAYAQTEAGAGSDFTQIATTAMPRPGGGFRVSGDKVWIGNGTWCGVMTVMANVCDRKGVPIEMAAFTVRTDRPGVTPGEELLSMGMRGMVQSKVSLRDVDVEPADVLGEPGEGLMVGVDSMMFTRFALGACAVGAMKRSLQLIQRFASRRSIASGRLLDSPVTLAFAGELVAKTAAADALLYTIADLLDAGSAVPLEALVAVKLVSSEFLWQAADRLVQILGSRGYDEANLAPQLLRDARVFRIFEGPTEALAEFLGSRALLDDSPGVYGFLRDELGSPELADRLAACVEQLRARPLDPRVPLSPNLEHAWRCALAGDAVAWAFLAGSLARRAGRTPTPRQRRVLDWTRLAFAAAVQRAVEGDLTQAAIDPADELGRAIEDYGDAIGVVDQTLAGESRQIDPLLREPAGG
ncbi:MAG TPA: acyl-CoA dehydrogenase family protein [Kofleriaceae bacterium]|nr:acyl-CoA dehydrogenase family protein [Kofleriaceae bacterium]